VLYDDPESARRHLDERSEAILRSELADDDALAALAWRVSFATTLGPRFLMRIATIGACGAVPATPVQVAMLMHAHLCRSQRRRGSQRT